MGAFRKDLPSFIIKRIPLRFTYDNNYFSDLYQGIPNGGYNIFFEKWLNDIDIKLNSDYFENKNYYDSLAEKVLFTGMIDQYYNYQHGHLEYRSLRFENELLDQKNFQGNAVVNYTDSDTLYTRIIEHKHFEFGQQEKTYITKEYSIEHKKGDEPYYPINDEKNNRKYKKYKSMSEENPNIIFGGRLAEYKYYDMDDVVEKVLNLVDKELGINKKNETAEQNS